MRARCLSIPYGLKEIATSWLDLGLSTTPIMVRGNASHTRRTCPFPPRSKAGTMTYAIHTGMHERRAKNDEFALKP